MGRIREASEEVCEEAEVVHSARMVLLWAMHALEVVSTTVWAQRDEMSY